MLTGPLRPKKAVKKPGQLFYSFTNLPKASSICEDFNEHWITRVCSYSLLYLFPNQLLIRNDFCFCFWAYLLYSVCPSKLYLFAPALFLCLSFFSLSYVVLIWITLFVWRKIALYSMATLDPFDLRLKNQLFIHFILLNVAFTWKKVTRMTFLEGSHFLKDRVILQTVEKLGPL